MSERPRFISKTEYRQQLKEASPEELSNILVRFDEIRLYQGAFSLLYTALALTGTAANKLSENEIVDNVTLAGTVITAALSMLSSTIVIKAHREGQVVAREIQSRGLEVPRGLIRRARN